MSLADIRPALRTFLLEFSTLAAEIGGERIHAVVLPQGVTAPSIVYNRISGLGDHSIQAPTGLAQVRMQIDAYAQTQGQADELSRLIKERLDGYSGPMGDVTVQGVFYDTMRDDYQDDVKLYRVSQDFMIVFEER
jgi:hypothetical protein